MLTRETFQTGENLSQTWNSSWAGQDGQACLGHLCFGGRPGPGVGRSALSWRDVGPGAGTVLFRNLFVGGDETVFTSPCLVFYSVLTWDLDLKETR